MKSPCVIAEIVVKKDGITGLGPEKWSRQITTRSAFLSALRMSFWFTPGFYAPTGRDEPGSKPGGEN